MTDTENTDRETVETIRLTADVVVVREDGKVLCITRVWPPFEGCLALPGGHVDPGEPVEAAAAREAGEETGVTVDPADLIEIGAFHTPGRDPRGRYVTIAYLAEVPSGTTAVADSDAASVRWVPFDDAAHGRGVNLAFDHEEILRAAWDRHTATA